MSTPAAAQVDWIALPLFVSWPVHTEGWRPSPRTLSKVCSASTINRRNMLCGDELAPELPVEGRHLQSLGGTRCLQVTRRQSGTGRPAVAEDGGSGDHCPNQLAQDQLSSSLAPWPRRRKFGGNDVRMCGT